MYPLVIVLLALRSNTANTNTGAGHPRASITGHTTKGANGICHREEDVYRFALDITARQALIDSVIV